MWRGKQSIFTHQHAQHKTIKLKGEKQLIDLLESINSCQINLRSMRKTEQRKIRQLKILNQKWVACQPK